MKILKKFYSVALSHLSYTAHRRAGNFQKPQLNHKSGEYLKHVKETYFQNRTELTFSEWQSVRDHLINNYKHINNDNVDSMIVGICTEPQHLPIAKSYVEFLNQNGRQANDATLGKLLRVYNKVYHQNRCDVNKEALTKSEQAEILRIRTTLKEKHHVLDSALCENIIMGLVATSEWREALEFLSMMKLSSVPSLLAYSELIIKAFAVGEISLGWSLVEELLQNQKNPKSDVFLSMLESMSRNVSTFPEEFEKFLQLLQKYDVIITTKIVNFIEKLASECPALLSVTRTSLKPLGICNNCQAQMLSATLSEKDFKRLQEAVLEKTLIGKDIFQKSTPDEVRRFKSYIDKTAPYDCVIDGLNVAYSRGNKKPNHSLASLLSDIVHYFVKDNKRVLVLGREHMNKWPKGIMKFVHDNANLFLTSDLSHDDPFLLYASLKSGQKTDFFSRDMMRQHAHLLGPELKHIFQRWQQEHQYSLITQTSTGRVLIKEPIRYLLCTQKIYDAWHLPYKSEDVADTIDRFDVPKHWLCLKLKE